MSMSPRRTLPRFVSTDAEVLEDPYPYYAQLRAAGPLCRIPPASIGVTGLTDVTALLRDPRLSNEFPEDNPGFAAHEDESGEVLRRIIPTRNTDDHSRLHKLFVSAFSPRRSRGYAGRIREIVNDALAPAVTSGSLDAVADLAYPVACSVICELMGLPESARIEAQPRAAALGRAFTPFLAEAADGDTSEALGWLRAFIADIVAGRRAAPGPDLVSRMIATAELTDLEIVDNLAFLFFTGFETTMNMVTTGCVALSRFPAELTRLRADRSLLPHAVEEFVRLDAPIQYTARVTSADIEIGGRTVRAGRSVLLMLGCANHDQRVFRDPARLDVGRNPNQHVGFGGGVRGCLGAALARIEGVTIFDCLADGIAELHPAAPPVREPNTLFRSYASVPLTIGSS